MLADEDRGGGRRQDAAEEDVGAGGGDAGGERRLEHVPGLARVADDQDLRAVAAQLGGRGPAEREGQLRGEHLPDGTADTVGPEQLLRSGIGGDHYASDAQGAERRVRPAGRDA